MSKNDKPVGPGIGAEQPETKAKRKRKTLIRKTRYLALEQRIVFDGALAADIVDKNATVDAAKADTAPPEKTLPAVDWSQATNAAASADGKSSPPAAFPTEKPASEK